MCLPVAPVFQLSKQHAFATKVYDSILDIRSAAEGVASPPQPMIDASEVAALAVLYDRYANAFERLSPDRLVARRQFFARFGIALSTEGADVDFDAFRFEIVKRCKEYFAQELTR